jgi:hypothetical protein
MVEVTGPKTSPASGSKRTRTPSPLLLESGPRKINDAIPLHSRHASLFAPSRNGFRCDPIPLSPVNDNGITVIAKTFHNYATYPRNTINQITF